jgi:hypothetical protein
MTVIQVLRFIQPYQFRPRHSGSPREMSASLLKLSSGPLVTYAAFSPSSTVGSRSVFASRARSAATRSGIAR